MFRTLPRQLVASLCLLGYLVSAIGGASGYVLCCGRDGHVALESGRGECCGSEEHPSTPDDGNPIASVPDCCVDLPLGSVHPDAAGPERGAASRLASTFLALAPIPLPVPDLPCARPTLRAPRPTDPKPPPALARLSCTVILI